MSAISGAAYRELRIVCGSKLNGGRLDTASFQWLLQKAGYTEAEASKYATERLRGGTIGLQELVPVLSQYPKLNTILKAIARAEEDDDALDADKRLSAVFKKHAAGDGRLYVNGLEALLRDEASPLGLSPEERVAAVSAAEELMRELTGSESAVSCGFSDLLELTHDVHGVVAHAVGNHVRAEKRAEQKAKAEAKVQAKARGKRAGSCASPASSVASPEVSPSVLPQQQLTAPPAIGGTDTSDRVGKAGEKSSPPLSASAAPAPATASASPSPSLTPERPPAPAPSPAVGNGKSQALLRPDVKSDVTLPRAPDAPPQPQVSLGPPLRNTSESAAAHPIRFNSRDPEAHAVPPAAVTPASPAAPAPLLKEPSAVTHRLLPSGRPAILQLSQPRGVAASDVTPPPPPAPASSPATTQSHPPPQHSRQPLLSYGRVSVAERNASSTGSHSARPSANDSPQGLARQRTGSPQLRGSERGGSHQFASPLLSATKAPATTFGSGSTDAQARVNAAEQSTAHSLPRESASSLNAQLPCPKLEREAVPPPSPSPLPAHDGRGATNTPPPASAVVRNAELTLQHITGAGHAGGPSLPPPLHVPSPVWEGPPPVTPGTPRHCDTREPASGSAAPDTAKSQSDDKREGALPLSSPAPTPSSAAPSPAVQFRDPNAGEPEVMKVAGTVVPIGQVKAPAVVTTDRDGAQRVAQPGGASAAEPAPVAPKPDAPQPEADANALITKSTQSQSPAHAQSQSQVQQPPSPSMGPHTHAKAHAAAAPKPGLVTSAFQMLIGAAVRATGLHPKPSP